MIGHAELRNRLLVTGRLAFETAFHVGTGEEGTGGVDMGVLLDVGGQPILPGSSLKGVFRSHAEALAEHLGLTTCHMSLSGWKGNGRRCVGKSQKEEKKVLQELEALERNGKASPEAVPALLQANLCDTCLLFGSVLARSKVSFQDAQVEWWPGVLERRDGVGIDRDSGRAVDQVKFDYEVVPAGSRFSFRLEAENLEEPELALLLAVLAEWERGFHLGGMTSRGLGAAKLEDVTVSWADFSDRSQLLGYLLDGTMPVMEAAERSERIRKVLEAAG